MSWLYLALLACFLRSSVVMVDQVMTRTVGKRSPYTLVGLGGFATLPLIAAMTLALPAPLAIDHYSILIAMMAAAAHFCALVPYYKALSEEEAYNVSPYFRFVPVFVLIYGITFFDEQISLMQLAGVVTVIGSAVAYAWDWQKSRIILRPFILVLISCLFMAFNVILLKQNSVRVGPTTTAWLALIGYFTNSAVLYFVSSKTRADMISALKTAGKKTVPLLLVNESLATGAAWLYIIAYSMAPATGLVNTVGGVQPLFAIFITPVAAWLAPSYFKPIIWNRQMHSKLILIAFMLGGLYLLQAN